MRYAAGYLSPSTWVVIDTNNLGGANMAAMITGPDAKEQAFARAEEMNEEDSELD